MLCAAERFYAFDLNRRIEIYEVRFCDNGRTMPERAEVELRRKNQLTWPDAIARRMQVREGSRLVIEYDKNDNALGRNARPKILPSGQAKKIARNASGMPARESFQARALIAPRCSSIP